jgi:hypothetical protein
MHTYTAGRCMQPHGTLLSTDWPKQAYRVASVTGQHRRCLHKWSSPNGYGLGMATHQDCSRKRAMSLNAAPPEAVHPTRDQACCPGVQPINQSRPLKISPVGGLERYVSEGVQRGLGCIGTVGLERREQLDGRRRGRGKYNFRACSRIGCRSRSA